MVVVALAVSTTLAVWATRATGDQSIIVQSTTSTKNSGFYDHVLPKFKKDTGVTAYIVAVGTGQAIRNAQRCDGDVLLVHAREAEEKFVGDGFGIARHNLMYNDFVIVGPPEDPASIHGSRDVVAALKAIASTGAPFVSRGDDSGTHKKERTLWQTAGVNPDPASGTWYLETGQGMGATLNIAVESKTYVMTDRATWISFKQQRDFVIHVEGDKALFNQYGVIQVNDKVCPRVKSRPARSFVNWLVSAKGQHAISTYRVDGQQLFFPNASNP